MQRFCSIFSQLLQLFPRLEFEQAVRQHHADRHLRGLPCWGQFVAMLFCQLGQAHSLREICGGRAAIEGKLKHLGLSAALHAFLRQRAAAQAVVRNRLPATARQVPRTTRADRQRPQVSLQKPPAQSRCQRHRPVRVGV